MAEPTSTGRPETGKPHSGSASKLPENPLIAKLGPELDPKRALVVLVGYPGPTKKDGFERLYSDLTFSSYYDIPSAAIVSWEQVNPEEETSPLRVFVDGSAEVTLVQLSSQSGPARYLQGSIANSYLQGALYPTLGGGPRPFGFTTDIVCGITISLAICAKGGAGAAGLPTTLTPPVCTLLPVLCAGGAQGGGVKAIDFTTDIVCGITISLAICAKGGAGAAGLPTTLTPPVCTLLPVLCAGGGAQAAGFTTDIVCGITISLAICAKGGAGAAGLPTTLTPPVCTLLPFVCAAGVQPAH